MLSSSFLNASWSTTGTLWGGALHGTAPSLILISTGFILNLPTPSNKGLYFGWSSTSVRVNGFSGTTVLSMALQVKASTEVWLDQEVVVGQLNVTKCNVSRSLSPRMGQYWDKTTKKWHVSETPLWLTVRLQVPSWHISLLLYAYNDTLLSIVRAKSVLDLPGKNRCHTS